VSVLKRILRRANLWGEDQRVCHTPLEEQESEVQRALTREEQALWLKVSQMDSRWQVIYWYSRLAFATCMSTNEIRSLRLGDIQLESGIINIPWDGSKNRGRHRSVQIGADGDEAFDAVIWLLDRARRLGSRERGHFLFPFRKPPYPVNPNKPMSVYGLRAQWVEVRTAAALMWFRQYDTRHTAITRLAEEGIPVEVIMDMAGSKANAMLLRLATQPVRRRQSSCHCLRMRLVSPAHSTSRRTSSCPR
jgi:integrase